MGARQRSKRQSLVDLDAAVWLPDGVQFTYWVPSSLHTAHAWFSRLLAEILAVHGDTSDWRWKAHEFAEAASVALDVAASADACGSGDAPKSACKRTIQTTSKGAASASDTASVSAAASASAAPWPACPALKIARGKKALQLGSALHYKLGPRLSEGSFETV